MNLKEEFRRPMSLGLASVVLILSILNVSVWALYSSRLAKTQARVGELREQVGQLSGDLQAQQAVSGTLAELQNRLATAKQLLQTTAQSRQIRAAELVELQTQLADIRLQTAVNNAESERTDKLLNELRVREGYARTTAAAAEAATAVLTLQVKQVQRQLADLKSAFDAARLNLDARRRQAADLDAQLKSATEQRRQLEIDSVSAQKKLGELRLELGGVTDQVTMARAELEALHKQREAGKKPSDQPSNDAPPARPPTAPAAGSATSRPPIAAPGAGPPGR